MPQCAPGTVFERLPDFELYHVPRDAGPWWVYGSIGAWQVTADTGHGYEFCVLARGDDPMLATVVCAAAHYHANPDSSYRLGLGHIVPIGAGFLGGTCDHLLVSKPYPIGPEFEICHLSDELHVQFLWLLPITQAERRFLHEHDLERLEQRFDDAGIAYLDPNRTSVA